MLTFKQFVEKEAFFPSILKNEGGYSYTNHADDSGGPTYAGITWRTMNKWRLAQSEHSLATLNKGFMILSEPQKKAFMRTYLTPNTVQMLYYDRYYTSTNVGKLDLPYWEAMIVDCGVLSGPNRAMRLFQTALNVVRKHGTKPLKVDGLIGTKTIKRAQQLDAWYNGREENFVEIEFFKARMDYYIGICKRKPSQITFLKGWINRAWAWM